MRWYFDHISRDQRDGRPVVKGTQVPISDIMHQLTAGDTAAQILAAFPTITEKDVQAVIAYATAPAERRLKKRRTTLRPIGLALGEFEIPTSFDEPLPDDLIDAFEDDG